MKSPHRPYDMTTRAAKAEATRERIRQSAMELYLAHPIDDFTLDQIAARAGTTVQTVLRAYGSRDRLMGAVLDVLADQDVGGRPTPLGDAAAFIGAVFDIYETIGDFLIRQLADQHRNPDLKAGLDRGRASHRAWVRRIFTPQLECRAAGDARERLFNALAAATDLYVWQILRRDQGLDRPAAEAVVLEIMRGITKQERTHGEDSVAELVGRRESAAQSGGRAGVDRAGTSGGVRRPAGDGAARSGGEPARDRDDPRV
jgi:AcrR family transcriptional regulator